MKYPQILSVTGRASGMTDWLASSAPASCVRRGALDRRRFVYRLTAKGMALAPVLVELVLWSDAHEETDASRETIKAMREPVRPRGGQRLDRARAHPPFRLHGRC